MKITSGAWLLFWILICWAPFALLARYSNFPDLHWLPLIVLGLGIFIFQEKPLQRYGLQAEIEKSLAALCLMVFVFHLIWVVLLPYLNAEENSQKPCSPKSLQIQCYSFSAENCTMAWDRFSQDCKAEAQKIRESRPTALLGPTVKRCTLKKWDQAFQSTRKTSTDALCVDHFKAMDSISADW